eukprot:scaffold96652_cov53-Attheya_sp.AAC.1
MAASSRFSFMDLLLDLALCIVEGEWVMGGTEVGLWMFFDLDIQPAEGGGLGNGGPGVVRDAGAMAGFVVLAGRWFHR